MNCLTKLWKFYLLFQKFEPYIFIQKDKTAIHQNLLCLSNKAVLHYFK